MIEANPALAPQEIKRLLIDTARRIPGVGVDRQGWGVVDAEKAVQAAVDARGRSSLAGAARARPRPA
jgi:serine protease AprX